jgi:ABC-type multidrug transport system ATPase subunit/pSer/pThr/pTyr-binding forkhead associated (FHA) protein
MRCPGCGEVNEKDYVFCRSCGRALKKEEDTQATVPLVRVEKSEPSQQLAASSAVPPLEAHPACKLTATAGLLSGRTFTIGRNGLMIGRDPASCQVVVADDEISRLHAWIGYNEEGEVILRDRNSANGTYVNQVRIQEKVLHASDEISFGTGRRHLFRLVTGEGSAQHVTPTISTDAPPGRAGAVIGGTSVLGPGEIAAALQAEKAASGTVKIKLTDLVARPHLELIVDKYAVRKLDIPDEGLRVGRDPSRCSLVLEHPSVSGEHAEFRPQDGKMVLDDRSTNGTFVNGLRVKTAELHDGDYITFGRYAGKSLIFRTGLEPELKVETIDLNKDRITIGRDPSNDVAINHPTVSNRHAEIVKQSGRVYIADLGSTNGTYVNGIKIKRHQLQELDRIVVGPSELHFSGASLSHAPGGAVVRLDVQDVSFQVPDRSTGKPKLLLDDISLVVRPRELIGLLGPSGAGKTTLMNALNGFVKPTSGQVLYNGVDLYRNLSRLKSTVGFVPQEDIMHKQLSVRRCLSYAAKLRLPEDLSDVEINRRVEEMLDILKIDPQRWDNPVGTLSGGQRKRVSIGIELLPKPGVLFLDEPTAGLDPRTETLMMMLFRQLANQGSTIIITTHLLASFGVLDKVVVLVQGRLAFYGPGTRFLDYFTAEAPPDVYDDLTDNNTVSYAQELKKRYEESDLHKELIADPLLSIQSEPPPPSVRAGEQAHARDFSLHQLKVLAARTWDLKFGDRAQTLLLFLQAPLVALLVALMASDSNQIQTIFMAMFAALWFGCSNAVREIVDEQTIYRRERQTGLQIPSYVLSKLFVLSFIALIQCVTVMIVLLLVNHAFSLSPPEILGAIGILFLVALNGTLIGLVISALVKTPEKALALFPLVLIPELLLSGLFMPVRKIQTVIPITVEQLFEGRLFAQPEAKAKAERMMHPLAPPIVTAPSAAAPESAAPSPNATESAAGAPGTSPIAPQPATGVPTPSPGAAEPAAGAATLAPGATEAAEAAAAQSETAHQVVGAMAPSASVQNAFHKYTPAPVDGMPTPVRLLSALAVSRWGLEALSDLCIHGRHSMQDSAYKIINTVYISFHPDDLAMLEKGLEAPPEAFSQPGSFPLPARYWRDQGPYWGVLAGFALVMTWVVLILMKRKDVK